MDTEMEKTRLAEQYAGMNDLELEELAGDWESLTDTAREALKNEIARRGLSLPGEQTPNEEMNGVIADPVAVREFPGRGEALLAWGLLNSGGIRCLLIDSLGTVLDPEEFGSDIAEAISTSGLIGPITLSVSTADYESAREVLSQPAPEEAE
jgi:hypothetical protein